MTERDLEGAGLEALFAQARSAPPELPAGLASRMLADAARMQADRARGGVARGWRAQLAEAIGGWFGVGGLATACAAGLWMGLAPPDGLDPVSAFQTQASYDLFEVSDISLALAEDN
ncbi:MAG: hypothetical protein KDK24_11645 [Pseudooceanicola sp.]|nr:hypothetical protein [Pseudooceanicola sp.]